jgi:peptide-methionine (R)-S-oxide reductase
MHVTKAEDERRAEKSQDARRSRRTADRDRIARENDAERASSGACRNNAETPGAHRCACCGQLLFRSEHAFEPATAWPSFPRLADDDSVASVERPSHGMPRTEVRCRPCEPRRGDGWLDGPAPAGRRSCIPSAALALEADG